MPSYILIPFAVFFVCCLSQFWFVKKVRDALIERHPDTFLAVDKSSIFPHRGIWRFTQNNQYKELRDENLNRHVRNLKRLHLVAITSWLAYVIEIFTAASSY